MRRDENGIAVPHEVDPRPWKTNFVSGDRWLYDCNGNPVGLSGDTLEFIPHAANYHQRLADIVRRISEWDKKFPKSTIHNVHAEKQFDQIVSDASYLWAEMTDETESRGE
jgi:hypothetical protein